MNEFDCNVAKAGVNKPPFLSFAADIPTFQDVRLPEILGFIGRMADGRYAFEAALIEDVKKGRYELLVVLQS